MSNTKQPKKSSGFGVFIIILIFIIVGFLLLRKDPVQVDPIPSEGINQIELENLDDLKDQNELSENNDITSIEKDLNSTSFAELEADLESFDF